MSLIAQQKYGILRIRWPYDFMKTYIFVKRDSKSSVWYVLEEWLNTGK